jgi:hypothetical protein
VSAALQCIVLKALGLPPWADPRRAALVTVLPGCYFEPSAVVVTVEGTPIAARVLIDFHGNGVWFYAGTFAHRYHTAWGNPKLVGDVIDLLTPHVPALAEHWRGK